MIDWSKQQTEDFIEANLDTVDWVYISESQNLSESFIEKYADKVDWDCISAYQILTESFCEKYNLNYKQILKIQRHCGYYNRNIIIYADEPNLVHIGCSKYIDDYISKIKSNF